MGDDVTPILRFRVFGVPVAQGSATAFVNPRTKKAVLQQSNKTTLRDWRSQIGANAYAAREAAGVGLIGQIPETISRAKTRAWMPVVVTATFYVPGPDTPVKGRPYPTTSPDVDKLLRALLDGLTGVAYHDDKQVVQVLLDKKYATDDEPPGVAVTVQARPV